MSTPRFKDHFSGHAAEYAEFRPKYPSAVFDFVASLPTRRLTAWDCATGSGQAAVPLADYFDRVIATDASREQIAHATPHPGVTYGVSPAHASGLDAGSVDLVTVAQALHWLPLEHFLAEVRRVMAPGGALAIWCYTRPVLAPDLDPTLLAFYSGTCGAYWPPERELVDSGYRTIELPIEEVEAPPLEIHARLTLDQFVGYLRTWSAARKLAQAIGRDPVTAIEDAMRARWNEEGERRLVRWAIHFRAGHLRRDA
jgi:SAM-dependent methyltransferase